MKTTEQVALRAQFVSEVDAAAPGRVMFAPGGVHQVTPAIGDTGASAAVAIRVDETTAAVLQASLAALTSANAPQRACIDKNHEGKEAMAWPLRFEWSNSPKPGVYAVVEWSKMGMEYVAGKVMRAFSGAFYSDAALPKLKAVRAGQSHSVPAGKRGSVENPARMTGLEFPYCGTLTNNPAFREILPLWAENRNAEMLKAEKLKSISGADASGAGAGAFSSLNTETKGQQMKLSAEQKAALQASIPTLEQEIVVLRAQNQSAPGDAAVAEQLQAKSAELEQGRTKLQAHETAVQNEALETALRAQRQKDANTAVQQAVSRGAIPAKDTATQDLWKAKLVEDPANLVLLQAMRGSPALEPGRMVLRGNGGVSVVREDSQVVLRAFDLERDPMKRGLLYKSELLPRLKEGDDMPLRAATITTGTLAGTIVTQRVLQLLRIKFPLLSQISTDFSAEPSKLNQVIQCTIISTPSVVAYESGGAGTGWADQDATWADVNIKLASQRGCPITIKDSILSSTVRRLFDEIAPMQAYAIAKDMVDALYAKITAANFTNAATSCAKIDFGRSTLIDLGTALDDRGVPDDGRFLILNSAYFGQLKKDPAIVSLSAFQMAEIIEKGQLEQVEGFGLIKAPNLPTTGNLAGFAGIKSSMCIVARPDGDYASVFGSDGNGTVQIVQDPDTGIAIRLVQYVNHALGTATRRLSLLYGVGAGLLGGASGSEPGGDEDAGQLLTS